ncbi:DUF2397 family protein [Actinoplanes sp. TBRC 11911]|uniref:DUF2397 family protein n=1 Tax=Actinoplanes sp. TBRC 11911 TaxID=2729386 RepID=UPI00145EF827|nr:DUF2397 family protein [Actinoplanes sp. TBRC 11911]NMO53402.1 DUF2397 family protein [Actinoplanes sp. TBRC 11911]
MTADVADEYIAIMRLFTGTLLTDLSAAEVAAQLRDRDLDIDPDVAVDRCKQLVLWGNLVRSVRETRVPTARDPAAPGGLRRHRGIRSWQRPCRHAVWRPIGRTAYLLVAARRPDNLSFGR